MIQERLTHGIRTCMKALAVLVAGLAIAYPAYARHVVVVHDRPHYSCAGLYGEAREDCIDDIADVVEDQREHDKEIAEARCDAYFSGVAEEICEDEVDAIYD